MTSPEPPLRPAVHFPPPTLFVLGLVAGWFLERINWFPIRPGPPLGKIGLALFLAGTVLGFWGLFTFARAKTGILPGVPAKQVVAHGPYRYSRNPMYTGMAFVYLGIACILNWGWCIILFPLVIYLIFKFVIQPEEAYLIRAFPSEYSEYRSRVRRWL